MDSRSTLGGDLTAVATLTDETRVLYSLMSKKIFHICKNCPNAKAIPKEYRKYSPKAEAGGRNICSICEGMFDAKRPRECNCV
jgi:hypothetical protein